MYAAAYSLFVYVQIFVHAVTPFVAVIFLGRLAWLFWKHYVEQNFIAGMTWTLLEIKPPRDVLRSPRAMELFFTNALYHKSGKGLVEKWWLGAVWFWFSLEIVSLGGQVHFYVRVPSRLKGLVETQMYAQYPQAEVIEADDYTLAVDEISTKSAWNMWGCEFGLERPEAYPIKTYVDFGLDKDPKEEQKIDPISPMIELFSSIEKDEQMWVQIVIRYSQKAYKNHGSKGTHDWEKEVEVEMDTILEPYTKKSEFPKDSGIITFEQRAPDKYKAVLEGMGKKITKLGFETAIRVCYVAKKEAFQNNSRRNLRLIFRQYSNPNANSFKRVNSTQFDYFWDYTQASMHRLKSRMIHEYQERAFFHPPMRHYIPIPWPISLIVPKYFHHEIFVLNVEELATIFHFPGQILKVPGLERVESKESAPPTNLPM